MPLILKIDPKVEIKSRIDVLHSVIKELASGFGMKDLDLKSLYKGIFERQIIQEISINYIDSKNERVGFVKMTIDWEKHSILTHSDSKNGIKIDASMSLKDQISEWYQAIINHISIFQKSFDVQRIAVHYRYKLEIEEAPEMYREALLFLGHSIPKKKSWDRDAQSTNPNGFEFTMEAISEKLSELRIQIEHNKTAK